MKRQTSTGTNATQPTSAETQKITGDEIARILWEASTKSEPTIQIQKESEKSRQFSSEEMRLLVR
jgi:hypothetical protein